MKSVNRVVSLGLSHRALVIFDSVFNAIEAEAALSERGLDTRVVALPPQQRRISGLALEIDRADQVAVKHLLRQGKAGFIAITSLHPSWQPMDLVTITDFDIWRMVAAGSIKLTYHKQSGEIVNISGGGFPDIPFLIKEIIGKSVLSVPPMHDFHSVSAWMLNQALKTAAQLYRESTELAEKNDDTVSKAERVERI
jgi:hypothetical protein